MKIVFAGTPPFAAQALSALIQAGHQIVAVYTQPDRPAGRGQQLMASAVKQLALAHQLPVEQPFNFKAEADIARLAEYQADLMIVAAYGLLLPPAVLNIPKFGCVNIHASLLPRWRGAAPIQRAIEAGDAETGVCIMQMEVGLDTGPVYCRAPTPITATDNTQSLHDKLAQIGSEQILHFLNNRETLVAIPQGTEGVAYAKKIDKAESQIQFIDALTLTRKIQALSPSPGAAALWKKNGKELRVKLLSARLIDATSQHKQRGQVLRVDGGLHLACAQGIVEVQQLLTAGGKIQNAKDWCLANGAQIGDAFQSLAL